MTLFFFQLEGTFLTVERLNSNGNWTTIATDADWETKLVFIFS